MFYCAWAVGSLAQVVGAALEVDDEESVRRCGQRIQACKRHLESWVERSGGTTISDFGSAGIIEVDPEHDEALGLAGVVEQLSEYLGGMSLHFGIGMTCGEAWRALKKAAESGEPYCIFEPNEEEQKDDDELGIQLESAQQGQDLEKADVIPFPADKVTPGKRKRKNAEVYDDSAFQQVRDADLLNRQPTAPAGERIIEGINGNPHVYDYSHMLPEEARLAGYQLHLKHNERADHYMNTTVLKDGVAEGQGWAYPSSTPRTAGNQAAAQHQALLAHQGHAQDLTARAHATRRMTQADPVEPTQPPAVSLVKPAVPPPAVAPQAPQPDATVLPFKKSEGENPKAAIREALQRIKEQAPAFEVLKQTSPEAYAALERVIMAMVAMAHQMEGNIEKAETLWKRLGLTPKKVAAPEPVAAGTAGGAGNLKDQKKSKAVDPLTGQAQGAKWHSVRSGQVMGTGGGVVPSREPNQP